MARKAINARARHLRKVLPEIDKMAAGLQDGMLEAFEMFSITLDNHMDTLEQADMFMAVVFELLPYEVQEKLLADPRLGESATVLPILKALRGE